MSNHVNDQLFDRIIEMMPDLNKEQRALLRKMGANNDLEGLWAWQELHYGKILPEDKCPHPSEYTKLDNALHCTQCGVYRGNERYNN